MIVLALLLAAAAGAARAEFAAGLGAARDLAGADPVQAKERLRTLRTLRAQAVAALMQRADAALYAAKAGGRNAVAIAGVGGEAPA